VKIDILVLNYNRKDLLELFLPSVCEAARKSSNECKVWVIDNASTDGSLEFVKKNFPQVNTVSAKANKVLFSYNDAVKGLDSDIVIFLNNDIKVSKDFIDPLANHFKDDKVFFAAPCVLNMDGTYNGGKSHFEYRPGMIKSVVDSVDFNKRGNTQMISCGAFNRNVYVKLGGFDELYYPGIWEDADLCYRGLKSGYAGIYEPRSVIWHDESTTFKKVYGNKEKMILAHRNMFLFFCKNISDPLMIITQAVLLIPAIVVMFFRNNREFVVGLFRALPKLGEAIKKRAGINKGGYVFKDRDLIAWKLF